MKLEGQVKPLEREMLIRLVNQFLTFHLLTNLYEKKIGTLITRLSYRNIRVQLRYEHVLVEMKLLN